MRYKYKVQTRFPTAELVAVETWADGSPRHWTVMVDRYQPGQVNLDIYDWKDTQGPTAAWRSAYYWCLRNPHREEKAA